MLIYTELEEYWDFVFDDCWLLSQSGIPAALIPYLDHGFRRLYLVMVEIRAGGIDVDSISAFPISNRELGVIRLIASSHGHDWQFTGRLLHTRI
jgi:hypothetical protein